MAKGWTQQDLGAVLGGIKQTRISALERVKNYGDSDRTFILPDVSVESWKKALGDHYDYVMYGQGSSNYNEEKISGEYWSRSNFKNRQVKHGIFSNNPHLTKEERDELKSSWRFGESQKPKRFDKKGGSPK